MKFEQIICLISIVLLAGCSAKTCPNSCDDNNLCTLDYCSNETNFNCVHNMTYIDPILEDDMSGDLSNWDDYFDTSVWSVKDGVLKSNFSSIKTNTPPYLFSNINSFKGDYALTGKFKLEKGILALSFRMTNFNSYIILLQNSVVLMKNNLTAQGIPPKVLSMSMTPISKNVWFNFKLTTLGNRIIFSIENRELIDVVDETDPLLSGNLGFAVLSAKNFNSSDASADSDLGIVEIDDVKIYEINSTNYECVR